MNTDAPTPPPKPTATSTPKPSPTPIPPGEIPDWQAMMELMGTGWNIGNTMDASNCTWLSNKLDYETAWTKAAKTTKAMIDEIAAMGFKTIRVPVSWHNHVTRTQFSDDAIPYYTIDAAWMKRVHEIVDYCIDDGLFVIINIHHDDASNYFVYPDAAHEGESNAYIVSIWEQISWEFADYDYHLIFETMNEPRLVGANEWNPKAKEALEAQKYLDEYNQMAVNTIRSCGGFNETRYISCPGYAASVDSLPNLVLPTDPSGLEGRIMLSVHAYTPYDFAIGKITTFNSSVKSSVDWVMKQIRDNYINKGIPAYIGEWGVYTSSKNYDERLKYAKYYVKAAASVKDAKGETVHVPTVIWDNFVFGDQNEAYGIFDRRNLKWFEPEYVKAIIEAGK